MVAALSGGEWGMGSGEWQNPMDATHALIPYSLLFRLNPQGPQLGHQAIGPGPFLIRPSISQV